MLPLVWFNPAFSQSKKIIISTAIIAVSIILAIFVWNSIKSISSYYKQIFSSGY
jgi:hypothetical protein